MNGTASDVHSEASIEFREASKAYADGTVAVESLSMTITPGQVCVLIGPSGCGKTTSMKMINRLIEPTSGAVLIDGTDTRGLDQVAVRRRIGYVIQQVGLFPHQTIGTNVATVPSLLGWDRARIKARVDEMLELVGLDPGTFRKRYPAQLSGGQQQRVGVARALAADPPVLLMDEPFGAVDPIARERLQDEFLRLQSEVRKTVVFVTHDLEEAIKLGDRIAIMQEGGVLAQYDTPGRILAEPASDFVADFLGADRELKRLSVTPLEASMCEPDTGMGTPAAMIGQSLKDAFLAVLATPGGRVAVRDTAGARVGLLTADAIARALRSPVLADDHGNS